jgi:hypothetical protein
MVQASRGIFLILSEVSEIDMSLALFTPRLIIFISIVLVKRSSFSLFHLDRKYALSHINFTRRSILGHLLFLLNGCLSTHPLR